MNESGSLYILLCNLLYIKLVIDKMPGKFLMLLLNTESETRSFLPECQLYLALHIHYLDMHIKQIQRRQAKVKLDRRTSYMSILSMLRRESHIYGELYSAIKERRYNDAFLLVKHKVNTKEERINYFVQMGIENRLQYRLTKCKMFKRRAATFEKVVNILKKLSNHVETCWSNILNADEVLMSFLT